MKHSSDDDRLQFYRGIIKMHTIHLQHVLVPNRVKTIESSGQSIGIGTRAGSPMARRNSGEHEVRVVWFYIHIFMVDEVRTYSFELNGTHGAIVVLGGAPGI
jgi:hypothetical protein